MPAGTSALDRLPAGITPSLYELSLDLDPRQARYHGTVAISLRIAKPTSEIWLHAQDLIIERATVTLAGGGQHAVSSVATQPGRSRIGILLAAPVPAGAATLRLWFSGTFGREVGIFRQPTLGEMAAFSDFEPIDARRGFPCFDEPGIKTPWRITLTVPGDMDGLSNMPVADVEIIEKGKKHIRFQETRPLPTYLIAVAVGQFDAVPVPGTPVPTRLIVPRGRAAAAKYAAAMIPDLLDIAVKYLDMPVPFPKLDFISVPSMNGAMENPGLITVGEHILLSEPGQLSPPHRRLLAMVIAHEIAHLWFGDLVTLSTWSDLWLNEGFATWMADKMLMIWGQVPKWDVEQVAAKAEAMEFDERVGVRAIRQVEDDEGKLRDIFDPLSYKKSGALLVMIEAWLSEPVFRAGVKSYLAAHADGNASTDDLIATLSAAAGRDIGPVLSKFLEQPGMPLVHVELVCSEQPASIRLTQTRYISAADQGRAVPYDSTGSWQIPLCMRYEAGGASRQTCALMETPTMTLPLEGVSKDCPAWIVPNDSANSYIRYHLPDAQLAALASAPLSPRENAELVFNVRALLSSGHVRIEKVLPLLRELARAPSRHTTEAILTILRDVHDHWLYGKNAAQARSRFAAYVRALYSKRAQKLGFVPRAGESQEDESLRLSLLAFVGEYGRDPWVLGTARTLADEWLSSGRAIEGDLLALILKLAAVGGDQHLYDRLEATLQRAVSSGDEALQGVLITALAGFREPALIERNLKLFVSEHASRQRMMLVKEMLASVATRRAALAYLHDNRQRISDSANGAFMLALPLIFADLCSAEELKTAETLVQSSALGTDMLERVRAEAARQAHACSEVRSLQDVGAAAYFHH